MEEFKRKIFIGGLLKNATEEQLEDYFGKFGKIKDILVNRSSKSGTCKGCAFIVFEEQRVAEALIQDPSLHDIGGKLVEVKSCHAKGTKTKHTRNELSRAHESSAKNCLSQLSAGLSTMPSPVANQLAIPEISPLVLCTPLHKFEFVPLEELESLAPAPSAEKIEIGDQGKVSAQEQLPQKSSGLAP